MALSLVTAPATEPLTIAEVKSHLRLGDSDGEPAPTLVTAALAAAGAGNVDNGAHRYLATFVTADGETDAGTISAAVTVADKTTNGKVALSAIPLGGSAVTARNLYRTVAAGATYLKLAQLADNTTTTYTDNIADSALGVQAPTTNTTADPELVGWITAARQYGETFTHRAFITQTWDDKRCGFPCYGEPIELPKAPLISVTSVSYVDANGDTQTWATSNYSVDAPAGSEARPGRIVPGYTVSYPTIRAIENAVTVRFVAGYGAASAVPSLVKACLKEHVRASWLRGNGGESQKVLDWVDRNLWSYKSF